MDDVLTVEQVAAITGLSRWIVLKMLREGTLAGGRTGAGTRSHWRISRTRLDAWLGVRARASASGRALRPDEV